TNETHSREIMAMIQFSINFILIGIILLSSILLGMYIYIVFKNKSERTFENRKENYIGEKLAEWDGYFRGNTTIHDGMLPKEKWELQAVENIFLLFLKNFTNMEIEEKIKAFSNQHFNQHYKKLLHSKKWRDRMNALYRIWDFEI